MTQQKDWPSIIAAKRASNYSKIPDAWRLPPTILNVVQSDPHANVLDVPRTCGILTEREIELTERYDATDLLERLRKGEIKSYDVTLAFCKRAAIAQQLVNCLTEMFFEEALEKADEADKYLAEKGKPIGVLHGLPISLKDSFNVKGVQATIGYVSFVEHPPASYNSALCDILLAQGAVFYVKTNLPQTMMSADSDNNLFGRTLNPHKASLTAGGSTGGEAALLKLRGSVLGVGTDIAGSIRIPAYCNGIWGFKPTVGRIPFYGKTPPGRLGSPSPILPTIGPEGHSIRDMELWFEAVIDSEPWDLDEGTIAVPWRRVVAPNRPLRLAVLPEDPKRPLHPTVLRTMTNVTKTLADAGHSVMSLEGKVPSTYDAAVLAWKFFILDPAKVWKSFIDAGNETLVKSIEKTVFPEFEGWEASLDGLFDMNIARRKIMRVYHDLIVQNQLDAILMPAYQATAVPHDTYGMPIYTVLPNLLDYPAGSIPYLQASKAADKEFIRSNVNYEPPYDADAVEGAPCGFQVVGKPMKDEELVKIMRVIADDLKLR